VIHSPELSGDPSSNHLVPSRRNGQKECEFGHAEYFCSYLQVIFLHAVTFYDMGPPALLHIRRKCCRFLLPLKILCFGRVQTCEPWVQ
jgi:hypothetical protein